MELKGLWKNFESVSSRCSEIEGQKMAKLEKKVQIHFPNPSGWLLCALRTDFFHFGCKLVV